MTITPTTPRPVAVCTRCGKYGFQVAMIRRPCREQVVDGRCIGVYGGAVNEDDWSPCDQCDGAGYGGDIGCSECQGSGWKFNWPG